MKISENSIFWWFNFACQESNFKIRMAITTILWLPKLLAVFYIFKPILSSEAQVPYSFLLYPTSAPIRTTRQSNSHASWPPSKLPILLQMGNPIFYSTSKINTEHPLDANGWCWYLVTNDTWTQKHKQVKRDVLGSTTHRAEGDILAQGMENYHYRIINSSSSTSLSPYPQDRLCQEPAWNAWWTTH